MVETLISKQLAILLVMVAGALLSRKGFIDKHMRQSLNRLLFYFVLPIMVFTSMRANITSDILRVSHVPLLFGAGMCFVNFALSRLLCYAMRIPGKQHRLLAFLSMFGNNIYLGLPLALALYGAPGVAVVLLYSLGSDLVLWSLGLILLSGEERFTLGSMKQVFTPTLLGLCVGVMAGTFRVWLPVAVVDALSTVSALASPLALLLTGAALAELDFRERLIDRQLAALVMGKLVFSPLVAALLASALGLGATTRTLIVILAGLPTFVRSIVITEQYGWGSKKTALGVLTTTLLSFVTLPLLLYILGYLGTRLGA